MVLFQCVLGKKSMSGAVHARGHDNSRATHIVGENDIVGYEDDYMYIFMANWNAQNQIGERHGAIVMCTRPEIYGWSRQDKRTQ
mmetsp:Transcript_30356/g.51734  ORF Transcript_30356/g.51734 Transcript_30356/m.51734 type:complete len:84 (-) Transcript_30356:364-615(-)